MSAEWSKAALRSCASCLSGWQPPFARSALVSRTTSCSSAEPTVPDGGGVLVRVGVGVDVGRVVGRVVGLEDGIGVAVTVAVGVGESVGKQDSRTGRDL